MPEVDLQKLEKFVLYTVRERQTVTELDSPAPGCESIIANRSALYEFFLSQEKAEAYINGIRKDFMERNKTLELKTTQHQETFLEGQLNHKYAHTLEIWHKITFKDMLAEELPENLEELLNSPKRRIVLDNRENPHAYFHGLLKNYKDDLSKIALF